ncbi:hypothetical protein N0V90_012555 [Kalmusia sp. IMI 367209]|nr:hypothetical protein N0V90_012555 [Kalmusia sp. IMI 367209]
MFRGGLALTHYLHLAAGAVTTAASIWPQELLRLIPDNRAAFESTTDIVSECSDWAEGNFVALLRKATSKTKFVNLSGTDESLTTMSNVFLFTADGAIKG